MKISFLRKKKKSYPVAEKIVEYLNKYPKRDWTWDSSSFELSHSQVPFSFKYLQFFGYSLDYSTLQILDSQKIVDERFRLWLKEDIEYRKNKFLDYQ